MGRARATSDLISHLPRNVTVNILLCLPLQEAVKTSLLSKSWRYKWTTIPHLLFDSSTFSSESRKGQVNKSELLAIIHQVLFQHEGPISKFMLSFPQLESCPEINHLISFLTRKSMEEFTLCISKGNSHKISSHLFSCLEMRLLCLRLCELKPPPDFAGFAKLTNLELCSVDLPASFAERFVAKCPLLQSLKLHECSNLDRVDFYAPNLQLFDYLGHISSISFKNTPSLKKASIEHARDWSLPIVSLRHNTWIITFSSLRSLEYLQLGPRFISMLAEGIARDKLASNLTCLVTLVLSLPFGSPRTTTSCTLCLIKSSPNLQKLVITLASHSKSKSKMEDIGLAIQFSKFKESSEFSLEKLLSVEMSSFSGLRPHMAFIELLLAKSPILETMYIYHRKGWSLDEKFSALQEICQVPRASTRAKVIFLQG